MFPYTTVCTQSNPAVIIQVLSVTGTLNTFSLFFNDYYFDKANDGSVLVRFRLIYEDNRFSLTLYILTYIILSFGVKQINIVFTPQDEIFDMVKPKDPYKITLQDLVNSCQGDTVTSILIDLNGFWTYENREVLVANDNDSSNTADLDDT